VFTNRVDAAVATLKPEIDIKQGFGPGLRNLPTLQRSDTDEDLIGTKVFKVGVGSGLTWGRIDAISATMKLQARGDSFWFDGLFAIRSEEEGGRPFSATGDTGAVVVREDGVVLGLLIGGSTRLSFACPIGPVLEEMNCEFLPPSE